MDTKFHEKSVRPPVTGAEAAKQIELMADRLRAWTHIAARSFGLYRGANKVIADAREKDALQVQVASMFREQAALIAIVRLFALLDRDAEVSFQVVNRALKVDGCQVALAAIYAAADPPSSMTASADTVNSSVHRFREKYAKISWDAHSRLQHFRNLGVAHLTWNDFTRSITYGELQQLVEIICRLSAEVSMMTFGLNDDPWEDEAESRFEDVIAAWTSGRVDGAASA